MRKYIFILLLLVPAFSFSQPSHGEEAYRNFIRKFYYHLLEDDTVTVREATTLFEATALEYESYLFNAICDNNPNQAVCKERGIYGHEWGNFASIFFSELKANKNRFTQGYDEKMDSIIDCCAEIYDEGSSGSIAIDLHFPNGTTIYFVLNRYPDEPIWIGEIYFENGSSFFVIYDKYVREEDKGDTSTKYLTRLAIINDPDGYTNVRDKEGQEAQVIGKIRKDQLFYYTPNYYSNWWRIKSIEGSLQGYMHCSRIEPYGKLPRSQWPKYENQLPQWR